MMIMVMTMIMFMMTMRMKTICDVINKSRIKVKCRYSWLLHKVKDIAV